MISATAVAPSEKKPFSLPYRLAAKFAWRGVEVSDAALGDAPDGEPAEQTPGDLTHQVRGHQSHLDLAGDRQTERYRGVDVATGDGADGVGDDQQRQPEGERDAENPYVELLVEAAGGEHRGTWTPKHEDEGTDQLGGDDSCLFHGFPPSTPPGPRRAGKRVWCVARATLTTFDQGNCGLVTPRRRRAYGWVKCRGQVVAPQRRPPPRWADRRPRRPVPSAAPPNAAPQCGHRARRTRRAPRAERVRVSGPSPRTDPGAAAVACATRWAPCGRLGSTIPAPQPPAGRGDDGHTTATFTRSPPCGVPAGPDLVERSECLVAHGFGHRLIGEAGDLEQCGQPAQ